MSGLFESWLHKLVGALQEREPFANVIVVDWMFLAHQLYTDAVNNTKFVGRETAALINWLQVSFFMNTSAVCKILDFGKPKVLVMYATWPDAKLMASVPHH